MNIIRKAIIAFLLLSSNIIVSQETLFYNNEPGTIGYLKNNTQLRVADGNSTIATSYTNTACGLNYATGSVFLAMRNATIWPGAAAQPAPIVISSMPLVGCRTILKAFLYVSTSGNGIPITATLTNPQSASSSFSMTQIGQGINTCWNYIASYTYRADVTSLITGNGTYSVSGIPAAPTGTNNQGNDAHGATLLIVYSDNTQTYSGSIVIADGNGANSSMGAITCTIGGFNVCGPTSSTSNFMLISDLQHIATTTIAMNSATPNYSIPLNSQTGYNWITDPGAPASVGQTTANYSANSGGDCYAIILSGMYFRTSCLTCTVAQTTPPNTPTLSIATSSNLICSGNSVTLTASGASTYSWSNGSNNSFIVISPTTTTTYWVYSNNANGCSNALITESVSLCTGLRENTILHQIKIYPNPSKGIFKIGLGEKTENSEIVIYNGIGQLIFKQGIKEGINTVDISKFSSGYYYGIVTENGKQVYHEKLIVE